MSPKSSTDVENLVVDMEGALAAAQLVLDRVLEHVGDSEASRSGDLVGAGYAVLRGLDVAFKALHDHLYETVINPRANGGVR